MFLFTHFLLLKLLLPLQQAGRCDIGTHILSIRHIIRGGYEQTHQQSNCLTITSCFK